MAILHASEVTKPTFCARKLAIMNSVGLKPKDEMLSTSLRVTFAIGRHLEKQIVHWCSDMGICVAHWRCQVCHQLHLFQKRPVQCSCGCKGFDPEEVRFHSPSSGISCGFDMLISLGSGLLRLVEIKTMSGDEFKGLVAPLSEHKARTQIYLRCAAESESTLAGRVDTNQALILYVTKSGFGNADSKLAAWGLPDKHSPFKEFTVTRDDEAVEPLVSQAEGITNWRRGGPMPCRICAHETAPKASYCPVRGYCFGTMFPEGEHNPNPVAL